MHFQKLELGRLLTHFPPGPVRCGPVPSVPTRTMSIMLKDIKRSSENRRLQTSDGVRVCGGIGEVSACNKHVEE